MRPFIQEIENAFGHELSPELISSVNKVEDKMLWDLGVKYEVHEQNHKRYAPDRNDGQLRPYLPVRSNKTVDWARGGVGLDLYTFDNADHVWKAVDNLKHMLLYCHQLAIDDPGALIFDSLRLGYGVKSNPQVFLDAKRRLQEYFPFLYHFKPLIDDGILILLSQKTSLDCMKDISWDTEKRTKREKRFKRLAMSLDYTDFFKQVELRATRRFFEFSDPIYKEIIIDVAEDNLGRMALMSREITGGVDFYLPFRSWRGVLLDLVKEAVESIQPEAVPDSELRLLTELISIDIPGISKLPVEDLISLRKNNETFNDWRMTLGRGLERLSNLPGNRLDQQKDGLRVLREEIGKAKADLSQKFDSDSFLTSMHAESKNFAVGAIGIGATATLLAQNVEELVDPIAAGAVSAMVKILWDLASRKGGDSSIKALQNHYVSIVS